MHMSTFAPDILDRDGSEHSPLYAQLMILWWDLRWEQRNEADLTSSGICILKSWQWWCHRLVSHHLTLHRSCAHLDTKEWAARHRLGGKEWWGRARCESEQCDVTSNQHNHCLVPCSVLWKNKPFPVLVSNLNGILFKKKKNSNFWHQSKVLRWFADVCCRANRAILRVALFQMNKFRPSENNTQPWTRNKQHSCQSVQATSWSMAGDKTVLCTKSCTGVIAKDV